MNGQYTTTQYITRFTAPKEMVERIERACGVFLDAAWVAFMEATEAEEDERTVAKMEQAAETVQTAMSLLAFVPTIKQVDADNGGPESASQPQPR